MSRCFPFPPPGYEKKTTTDDLALLKKEKQKEKKLKKEKKDKEKKEGKEKGEKDKSDGKHREKKDKKEKGRDKKKDKDRDRDKDKSSNLDEKRFHGGEKLSTEGRFPGQSESHNGEKISNERRAAGRSEDLNGEKVSYEKRLPLQSESRSGEKIIPKENDKHRSNISNERSAGQFANYNEKVSRSIPLAEDAQDSKISQELDRRVREEMEGMLNPVGTATVNGAGGNDKKDKRGADRKIDEQELRVRGDTSFSGSSMVENFTVETTVGGLARPLEPNVERKMEGKEKTKDKGGDDKRRDKRKDRDKEKKGQEKDRERDKERKEEKKKKKKAREKKENKAMEQDQVKESIKNDIVGIHDVKPPYLSEDSNQNAASEENLRKRKDTMTNGFLHATESGPNKLPRPTLSSHSSSKNGRIVDPYQTSIPICSDREGAATNVKVDSKVNGTTEAQLPSVTKTPLGTVQTDPIAESSKIQPPHPDSKYLRQILCVPKMEELSDFEEENWLVSSSFSKKSKLESCWDEETPTVWSEGMRIETADVYALPYVIPY